MPESLSSFNGTVVVEELLRYHRGGLNKRLLLDGLRDGKIAGMHFLDGVLYILHDNDMLIRSWNVTSGYMISEIPLPKVENSNLDKQWEGFALLKSNTTNTVSPLGGERGKCLRYRTQFQR